MLCNEKIRLIKGVAMMVLVGAVLTGGAEIANAGLIMGPAKKDSSVPCLFTWQLQNLPEERERYALKLLEVLGHPPMAASDVVQMYSNIVPAAYSEEKGTQSESAPSPFLWRPIRHSEIDGLSADCLGCHDGVGARPVTTVLRNDPFASKLDRLLPGNDHPIGMDYENYAALAANTSRFWESTSGWSLWTARSGASPVITR